MTTPRYVILDRNAETVLFDTKTLIEPIAKVLLDDTPSSAVWAWADGEPGSPAHPMLMCDDLPQVADVASIPKEVPDGYWVMRIQSGHHFGAPPISSGTPVEALAFLTASGRPSFVAAVFEHHLKPVTLKA
ncbi:MAG: hypothetical protein O9256_00790 [Rhizobiaceae bacterium]|nr:hypothetical protein [Rhizobiaceae bacterium]